MTLRRTLQYTLFFVALVAVFLSFVPVADAQKFCTDGKCYYTPLEPLPGVQQDGNADFPLLLSGLFKVLLTFGSIFAVVMLTVAGISYMLSDTPVKIQVSKDRAKAALWGLILLISCWLILYTINPKLLNFEIFNKSLEAFSPNRTRLYVSKESPIETKSWTEFSTAEEERRVVQEMEEFTKRCEEQHKGEFSYEKIGNSIHFNCYKKK